MMLTDFTSSRLRRSVFLTLACAALLSGCATGPHPRSQQIIGESVVLVAEEPSKLAFTPLKRGQLRVRSQYLPGSNSVQYSEGRDFVIDYAEGSLRRAPQGGLPDFRTNVLFGKEEFDHSNFPGYGNARFFVFVDYKYSSTNQWPMQPLQAHLLRTTQAKLHAGVAVKIVAFGDSITAGGEASQPKLIFWQRWADGLQHKYPRAAISAVNGATGGDTTIQGLQRLQSKVLDEKPDLVLIAFGMNDHNLGSVPIPQFEANLKQMIAGIRTETGAEVILLSTFPPNPRWKFGSHQMAEYAKAAERAARDEGCAYANVFDNWQTLAARKKPEDLLGNNINHPNDFGHWIYWKVLDEIGL